MLKLRGQLIADDTSGSCKGGPKFRGTCRTGTPSKEGDDMGKNRRYEFFFVTLMDKDLERPQNHFGLTSVPK